MRTVECQVWSEDCGVWWSVVECGVCGVCGVKYGVYSVKCGVWSVKCGVSSVK